MLKFLTVHARRFSHDRHGNVALLFGLVLVPLILILGLAVDYGRAMTVRGTLSDASDAAALAVGSWVDLTDAELKDKAQKFFDANYASSLSKDIKSDFQIRFVGDDIVVKATASVPTIFMRLANINNVSIGIENTITTRQRNVELALVLDTTGSMRSDGKIEALKDAAQQMLDVLFGERTTSDTLDIAVVPFAAAVNVGSSNRTADWLDTEAKSQVAQEDFTSGTKPFNFFANLRAQRSSWDWQGCVRERVGSTYELTDATPTSSDPESLFAPFLAPDEPDADHDDGDRYRNSYIDDLDCGETSANRTPETCQRFTGKYNNVIVDNSSGSPNANCPPRAIVALSNDKSIVSDAINALEPNGYTNIPSGLLWGWRVLSPSAPYTEAKAYDEKKRVKAIVLLTDGSNDPGRISNHNGSTYNAFGYAAEGHLGSTSGSEARATLDAKTQTACNNIKAKGILIYTIGFRVSDSVTNALLSSCATKPDMYYSSPTNSELAGIFADIGQGLSELRIAQ